MSIKKVISTKEIIQAYPQENLLIVRSGDMSFFTSPNHTISFAFPKGNCEVTHSKLQEILLKHIGEEDIVFWGLI